MENPLDNTDLKVGLETEPNIRESAGSVVARASSKVHEEVDPIEEPVIYEILPSEFYPLKKRFSVSVPLIGLALMDSNRMPELKENSLVASAPTARVRMTPSVYLPEKIKQKRNQIRS